jgi:MFS family permease
MPSLDDAARCRVFSSRFVRLHSSDHVAHSLRDLKEHSMIRTILAALTGYCVIAFSMMVYTVLIMLALGIPFDAGAAMIEPSTGAVVRGLVVSLLSAVLGGWVAARIDSHAPRRAALLLCACVLVLGAVSAAFDTLPGHPVWYRVLLPFVGALGVAVGGLPRQRV